MNKKSIALLTSIFLLMTLACSLTAQSDETPTPAPTDTPIAQSDDGSPFVSITEPVQDGSTPVTLETGTFRVAGQVRGSFENNVIVQALDESGEVLAETFTTATGGGFDVTANWELNIQVFVDVATPGTLRAYFTSARDGSTVAEDTISVIYGQP